MGLQNENTLSADYLAPDIAELARQRGGQQNDPSNRPKPTEAKSTMTRAVARRLVPACIAVPAVLWWALFFAQRRGMFTLETSFVLFVFSVTAVFGLIVCLNLKRLSRMDRERAQSEEQLRAAKDNAENANRFKSAFFANISHEIRTPLTAINGFAELLMNPKRTEDQRLDDARVIRRNGEHLLTLINDILDLSKIEAGRMSVERIHCCPAMLIGEVCSMLRQRATAKRLTLDVNFDGIIPQSIHTDPMRLRQILINLISNAIKFTSEGGIVVTVSINPSVTDPRPLLQVKIADTGSGIPAERMQSLFEPFVQGEATITRKFGGTGLGLTISRHFSQALGGDVAVTSSPGRGSTFTVTVETGSLTGVPVHHRPQEALEIQQDTFAGPQVRIYGSVLVAEDGVDNQTLIATKLRQTGLNVELAPDGQVACEKALAAFQTGRPFDLILMDVQMPVMDGYSATLHLRSKGYRGPVIALTANAMERDRTKCLNAGCNDFVTKPIQMEKLFKAMGRYLTVEQLASGDEVAVSKEESDAAGKEAQINAFFVKLADELGEMERAIERQDRVRLKDLIQLTLGNAATLELKDLAAQAAKLLRSAEDDTSWQTLLQAVREFAKEARPVSKRHAA